MVDVKQHWREDLPAVLAKLKIRKEEAELMVKGKVRYSRLVIISPESDVYPHILTENACWVVHKVENGAAVVTVIDAVEGAIVGNWLKSNRWCGWSRR